MRHLTDEQRRGLAQKITGEAPFDWADMMVTNPAAGIMDNFVFWGLNV